MTTQWQRLAGDTGQFAVRISFAADPDEGQGIDPEVGLSWGSFQIWAQGRNLCAHIAQGERVDSVHCAARKLISLGCPETAESCQQVTLTAPSGWQEWLSFGTN